MTRGAGVDPADPRTEPAAQPTIAGRGRPSALVVLGVYAGIVAALAILPATLPLLYRLVVAEHGADAARTYERVASIANALQRGLPLPADASEAVHVHAVSSAGGTVLDLGPLEPDPALEDAVCGEPAASVRVRVDGEMWAAGCYQSARIRVFAIWPSPVRSYLAIGGFVVLLATIAGIVTALGTLQLLRPVAKVSAALARVTAGTRAGRMELTGIAEIDELVTRLNAAASAVEEREHHILGRVQVVQEMARLVAHEVRNPLQSLELLTTLVAEETDPAERTQLAANIHAEIRTLDDVVTRLLREGATRGALRLQIRPCDVNALLEQICALRSLEAKRKGATVLARTAFPGEADLDRAMFGRAIENLVANAIRAVPPDTGLVHVTSEADGDWLLVRVDDNGPGVDPVLGEAVFEPNVSGSAGTGLGLSLTRGVADAHGGSVRLGRAELGGARFELRIPRHAAPASMR